MGARGSKPPKGALIGAAGSGDSALVASVLDAGADILEVDDQVSGRVEAQST